MTEEKDRVKEEEKHDEDDHHKLDLRGTFMMVMAIGGLMLLSWFGAFIIFMERMYGELICINTKRYGFL